jgi:hypothetical protein
MEAIEYNLYDNEDNFWSVIDSSTLTPDQIEIAHHGQVVDEHRLVPPRPRDLTVLISCNLENDRLDSVRECQVRKFLWSSTSTKEFSNFINAIVFESSEDQLVRNASENTATLGGLWPEIMEQTEAEASELRGVYTPIFKRKVIFSEVITLKTSELPRWKPNAIIGKQSIEEDHA